MRTRIWLFLAAAVLSAQIKDMTAPGNGADLYYSLANGPGPIYRIGTVPATLFDSVAPPVMPPPPAEFESPYYISPYYQIQHPQFSRDASVFAYTADRVCLGGEGCVSVKVHQTTVQANFLPGALIFSGTGWLSGNGRFLLTLDHEQAPIGGQPALTDLVTGLRQTLPGGTFDLPGTGRTVADDGSAVYSADNYIFLLRAGNFKQLTPNGSTSRSEPVIDAAAQTVLYTERPLSGGRYLRIYSIATGRDSVFAQANGDTYAPSLSADGTRVMFLSTAQWGTGNPPGVVQLYAANPDGSGFQELTSGAEPSGVQIYAMSDDGQVAWYLTGDGKLVKLELAGGQAVRRVFHPAFVDLSSTLVPGSAVTLSGTALSGVSVLVNSKAAPVLSVSPASLTFQVPWEVPPGVPASLQVLTNAGTPAESSAQATLTPAASFPQLLTCTQPGCFPLQGGAAIHADWSGFVSPGQLAQGGEILHFFGTGFGPVDLAVPTGALSPAGPPAKLVTLPACTFGSGLPLGEVVWAGLAPGLVGYYQLDVRIPAQTIPVAPLLSTYTFPIIHMTCGPGINADFAVGPAPHG